MSGAMLRKYHKERILINPFSLSGNLYPLIDNGYGENIEDKNGIPVVKNYTKPVRISYEKKWIKKIQEDSSPIIYEKRVYYMVSDYETIVDVRLEFTYNGIDLKVTQRKELRKYNTLIGYEYELKELTGGNIYG